MPRTKCFIDTETTGLDVRIHEPWEVCMWREDRAEPTTFLLPHHLFNADPISLNIGGYWDRDGISTVEMARGPRAQLKSKVAGYLDGTMLVGSKPEFDGAMLTTFLGRAVWHHRLLNVVDYAMGVFDWHEPPGLAAVITELKLRGYPISRPDHTAEGDVRATRAAFVALQQERKRDIVVD